MIDNFADITLEIENLKLEIEALKSRVAELEALQ
jgi:hypothetical protein